DPRALRPSPTRRSSDLARKLHTAATALLGGVVVFACALTSWLVVRALTGGGQDREAGFLLAGAVLALALGLWDDRFGMQPVVKVDRKSTRLNSSHLVIS